MTTSEQKQALINLRAQLVGTMHVQPFTIYQDATIEALLAAKPKTLEALSKVKGFPAKGKRVQGFGFIWEGEEAMWRRKGMVKCSEVLVNSGVLSLKQQ